MKKEKPFTAEPQRSQRGYDYKFPLRGREFIKCHEVDVWKRDKRATRRWYFLFSGLSAENKSIRKLCDLCVSAVNVFGFVRFLEV